MIRTMARSAWLLLAFGCGAEEPVGGTASQGLGTQPVAGVAGTGSAGTGGMRASQAPGAMSAGGSGGMGMGMARGASGASGSTAGSGAAAGTGAAAGSGGSAAQAPQQRFSFFITSLRALQELSKSQNGFGGDLRYGETGAQAGLRGADKICTEIAEQSMPGSGQKQWRAFLSAQNGGPDGGPVHAIERIGNGPWYDRMGRLVSMTKADLAQVRPASADPIIRNDLPNEDGVPNKNPDGQGEVDNHHMLTGSGPDGRLVSDDPAGATCEDWTSAERAGRPRVGLSWPRGGGRPGRGGTGQAGAGSAPPGGGNPSGSHWISAMNEAGCGAGVSLVQMGGPDPSNPTVGSGGGYGGFYCFALSP